jgi:hypothetical protein
MRRRLISLTILAWCGIALTGTAMVGDAIIGTASAQVRMDALAGSGSALLNGIDVVNPALLAVHRGGGIRIAGFTVGLSNNSFSVNDYNTYNGEAWDDARKQEILDKIPGAFEYRTNVLVGAPSVSVGRFAFTTRARVGALGALPEAVFDLALNGNIVGRDYTFDTAKAEGIAIGEARLSYGRSFDVGRLGRYGNGRYGFGISLKYLYGGAYGKLEDAHGFIRTDPDRIRGEGIFRTRSALGGSGLAMDLGTCRDIGRRWMVSFTLQDLFASVKWNHETEENTDTLLVTNGNMEELDNGEDAYVERDGKRDIPAFKTKIPGSMVVGVARSSGMFSYAADWEQGFGESALTHSGARLAVGGEMRPLRVFALRAGLSAGGKDERSASFGLGLNLGLRLDLSVSNKGGFLPSNSRGIGVGLALGIGA